MRPTSRRQFLQNSLAVASSVPLINVGLGSSALGALLLNGCASVVKKPNALKPNALGRVVVVGGGFAGATAAKYLRMWSNNAIEVTVIEPSSQFVSCPLSNLVLGGSKTMDDLTFAYSLAQKIMVCNG